jgi:ribose-phosphate pyrophosphokinase
MLQVNGKHISYFTFPGGELQVQLPEIIKSERVVLKWKPKNATDVMLLMLTVDALYNAKIIDIDLEVIYLPYARQDRVCSPGEAFSLSVICKMLDFLDLTTIRLWDVHNDVLTLSLFKETYVYHTPCADIFSRFKILDNFDISNLILCAPDQGAISRVRDIVRIFELANPINLEKKRDAATGKIKGMSFNPYNRDINGFDIMVIDDICDGGATFIEGAKILRAHGAERLYLYVTHGIFSKGLDELLMHYEHIICHHVLDDDQFQSSDKLTILQGE